LPQYTGALGAAILARRRLEKLQTAEHVEESADAELQHA
jgi:hypothetical protein